jgi:protein TonB
MAGYRQNNPDRAKAAIATLIVHVVIGAAFLTGLVTNVATRSSEAIQTFDVTEPPPPPPVLEIEESAPKGDPGEAGKKADPTPIVVPEPKIEVPARPPVIAAPVPAQGAAPSAGAAQSGTGTGAGGSGSGLGGGGAGGSGAGFTPARRISKIPDREYRRFVDASGMRRGSVAITVKVNTDGRPSDCRIVRSSGNAGADALMCQLTVRYVRFRPARDPQGQLAAQDITWVPDWRPN